MAGFVVVMGATGAQGGGLVTALLKKGGYKIRAVTRNVDSEKAKALAQRSPDISVVQGDFADKHSLVKAFTGASSVFIVTDCFVAGFDYEAEFQQGKTAVDAASEAKVPFVVFSALEDTRQALKGTEVAVIDEVHGSTVTHFDSKAAVAEYLAKSGLSYALLLTCPYYENSLHFWQYRKGEDGVLAFADNLGPKAVAWHSVEDIGASAAVLIGDPQKYAGKTVPVVGQILSLPDAAATISKVTGITVKYNQIPDKLMAGFPFTGAHDLANMFAYYRVSPQYAELRPMDKRVYEGPSFAEWAEANVEALKAKLSSY